jgi:hypothetical protein
MSQNAGVTQQFPSQHQVREISARGIPVPPSYAAAQALLDSLEPSQAQQKRLDELGLQAATRGEAKEVLNAYVEQNPEILKVWEAENAQAAVARRQERRGQQDPRVTSQGLFQLLADAGVKDIPSDHATASAMADALPPSDEMARVLREHGRATPATRAEATEIIRGLPATPKQVQTIMERTFGRWAPRTRGDAERWFQDNPLPANNGGGFRGGYNRGYRGNQGGYRGGYQRAA